MSEQPNEKLPVKKASTKPVKKNQDREDEALYKSEIKKELTRKIEKKFKLNDERAIKSLRMWLKSDDDDHRH
jgi:hypothetical protein